MSSKRKQWEVLIGDARKLNYLATLRPPEGDPHPLQDTVEELVDSILTEKERQVYYMRFGQRMPHRAIAEAMGYKSHRVIQILEERIIKKIGEAIVKNT